MKDPHGILVATLLALMLSPVGTHAEEIPQKRGLSQGVLYDLNSIRDQVLYEIRVLDAAKDQYALDKKAAANTAVSWNQLKRYLKPTTRLGLLESPMDLLGNPIELGPTGSSPLLSKRTVAALKLAPADPLWARYCAKTQ